MRELTSSPSTGACWCVRSVAAVLFMVVALGTESAAACGGFFCNRQPVDQQAERIVFALGSDATTMIVQIAYTGEAADFAWLLPVRDVPDASTLDTFPARALTALDAATAPIFVPSEPTCEFFAAEGPGPPDGVTVHIDQTVGPYDVAVIEATDSSRLVNWLLDEGYRVTDAMVPRVALYSGAGMKMLALKLTADAEVGDIAPLRMDLPPGSPTIPLLMTAVAAEPDMGIVVFILAEERWGGRGWPEVRVDPAQLRMFVRGLPFDTNYYSLVSRAVDAAGGRGWVTEMAWPTPAIVRAIDQSPARTMEQVEARDALLHLLDGHAYLTRLYTRLSPEEMIADPMFAPRPGPNVARALPLESADSCNRPLRGAPCDFSLCGSGACREVVVDSERSDTIGACECPVESSARLIEYSGTGWSVPTCVDPAMSFVESPPGSVGDPCHDFDCGLGRCMAVNMTATCQCDTGAVAIGFGRRGATVLRCVDPDTVVPWSFVAEGVWPVSPPSATEGASGLPAGGGGCHAVAGGGAAPGWVFLLWLAVLRYIRASRRVPRDAR